MQMDLMFFDKPKIKGTAGVLNVIDVHSRRAFSERIKTDKLIVPRSFDKDWSPRDPRMVTPRMRQIVAFNNNR